MGISKVKMLERRSIRKAPLIGILLISRNHQEALELEIPNFKIWPFAKLIWRILINDQALWVHILKSKYFPRSNLLRARNKQSATPLWRNIINVKDALLPIFYWDLRDPDSISIWEDPWVPTLLWKKPLRPTSNYINIETVSDLLMPNKNFWNQTLLNNGSQ